MKSTHWSYSDDPEQWRDNPEKTPEEAARQFIEHEDSDLACDIREDLLRGGSPIAISAHGYYETDALIPDGDDCFDGYEPGCTYFMPTGEDITVIAEVAYRKASVEMLSPNATVENKAPSKHVTDEEICNYHLQRLHRQFIADCQPWIDGLTRIKGLKYK